MKHNQPPSDLSRAVKACRQSFVAVGVFSLFINLLMLVPPLYMLQVYDRVLTFRSEYTLLMLTLLMMAAIAVMGGLEWVRSRILVRVGARLDQLINRRLFEAMFDYNLKNPKAGSAQPLQDLTTVRQFLTGNGLFAFFDAPWMPVYIAVLFLFHPWFGWIAIGGAIVLAILAVLNEMVTRKPLAAANSESIGAQQYVNRNLRNAEVLEAMGMLSNIQRRWLARHEKVLSLQALASDRAGNLTATSKALRIMLQSLILGAGALLAVGLVITPGVMIAASILTGRALAPIDQLIGGWRGFVGARAAYQRLEELLKAVPERPRAMSLPAPQGKLAAEQVVVIPPGGQVPVLRAINLTIEPGECLGVIGSSASGKSSLARTLLGIWPCHMGTVRLDGADVCQWNRDELGPYVGYLPQDIELFDGTIAENIARFGDPDPEQVVEAARRAGVHELILQQPQGYDTPIGTSGGVLSGGQRQRVGLARALYGDPVLIILDEPNSNLDEAGESALLEAFADLRRRGRTVIVITHRPNILSCTDRVLLLNQGRIAALGPRDEVLSKAQRPVPVPSPNVAMASAAGNSGSPPAAKEAPKAAAKQIVPQRFEVKF
ncbi:MAG: type I secretion system permease/ATPase [Candidatus Competibacterales bacterium]